MISVFSHKLQTRSTNPSNDPIPLSFLSVVAYPTFDLNRSLLLSVVHQFYKTRVIDEYVLNGNSAILKCLIPSFIADFISVTSWVSDDGTEIEMDDDTGILPMGSFERLQLPCP